jgi:hypothetical protein
MADTPPPLPPDYFLRCSRFCAAMITRLLISSHYFAFAIYFIRRFRHYSPFRFSFHASISDYAS